MNLPGAQQRLTILITNELQELLDTELSIGRINPGLLNRIIIDDVLLKDRSGDEMLKVTRLSAKFDILPLFQGKISIGSVQLFGFNANLTKENPDAEPNFKFLIDAFASNDSLKKSSPIDLRINSILIRRGKLSYDVLSEEDTPTKFNPNHINIQNIIGNISLKALNKDSLNAHIKRLSFDEKSGFELSKLSLKVLANHQHLQVESFSVNLPHSSINMDTISLRYNNIDAFSHFADSVHFNGKMLPSHLALQDLSAFVPGFHNFRDKVSLDMSFDGRLNQLNFPRLEINMDDEIYLRGEVSFQDLSQGSDAYVYGSLQRLYISRSGMNMLIRNLSEKGSPTPPALQALGNLSFKGEVSGYFNDIVTYGILNSDLGTINADVKWSADQTKGIISTSGNIKTNEFELGKLIRREDLLGKLSFNLNIISTKLPNHSPRINLKGLVPSFQLKDYTYNNIELDGEFDNGGFDGKMVLDDENGHIVLNGHINAEARTPVFNFEAELKNIRPHDLHLTSNYKDAEFSLKLSANFTGNSIDNAIGEINIDSVYFISPEKYYFMDNLSIKANQIDTQNQLLILSDFLVAEVKGNYSYRTIPNSIIKIVERYIPSLLTLKKDLKESDNNFNFDIQLLNTSILTEVFEIPFYLYAPATIKGYFNDIADKLKIEAYFPVFQYGNRLFESGMILCENPSETIQAQLRVSNKNENSVLNLSLQAEAQNNILKASVNWGNNSTITHSGQISTVTNFFKTEGKKPFLHADINVQPTEIILSDSIWNINPSTILVDSGRIYVDNFLIQHEDQFLQINGNLTKDPSDTVKVVLKDINVGYIFDVAQIDAVDFTGMASGDLFVNQALQNPEINTNLFVKDLSLNNGLLGDANIFGKWDKEVNGIYLDADIREYDISHTRVDGHILIKDKGLNLHINADRTNIKFIEYYMQDIATNLKGRVKGKARLFGGFKSLNLEGDLFADASFKINVLNTSYSLSDSIHMRPDEIQFNDIRIYDKDNHSGVINGYLRHKSFKELNYLFQGNINNMLVYDTKEDPEMPFYGTVYGTGDIRIDGNSDRLYVDATITSERNTTFVYLLNSTASAASNQFITFVDKTPRRNVYGIQQEDGYSLIKQEEEKPPIDIRLNLQVNATPDGNMRIIMDPIAGDYISGKGSGNILVDFYNKGDVKMFGSYTIDQGIYKFSLQEVIRKDFIINAGSTIDFNGDPINAILDIQASYTVNSASLSDLGIGDLLGQNNIRVNCIMNLSGNLTRPVLKFDIDLPYVNEEQKDIVRSVISTEEQMNMQILYLLGIGKFYTYDTGNQSSNAMSSMLSTTLSGQLNNMFSQIIDNNNWNFGTNLSTGEKGWTEVEVEGMLSGQLLNNRLLINGNFGYRDNPYTNNNFVGDFDLEYLLTRSGDIRLKAYNQTNNNRFFQTTALTIQGIGIAYKKDFNKWNDLRFWGKKKSQRKDQQSENLKTDNELVEEED